MLWLFRLLLTCVKLACIVNFTTLQFWGLEIIHWWWRMLLFVVGARRNTEQQLLQINCSTIDSECGWGMWVDYIDPEEEGELHALSEFPCSTMLMHERRLATDNHVFQTLTTCMHACVCVCVFSSNFLLNYHQHRFIQLFWKWAGHKDEAFFCRTFISEAKTVGQFSLIG